MDRELSGPRRGSELGVKGKSSIAAGNRTLAVRPL
jgi:hypothetical protein